MRCTPSLINLRSFRIWSRPQQNRDRWIGQYSFRRSLIGYLLWQRANLRQMGSRNGHSQLLQVWWGRFQTDTKDKPVGVSLLLFARQLFHVWELLSAKGMF